MENPAPFKKRRIDFEKKYYPVGFLKLLVEYQNERLSLKAIPNKGVYRDENCRYISGTGETIP
jgi:hypothetical protein